MRNCTWKTEFNTNKYYTARFGKQKIDPDIKLNQKILLDTLDRGKDLAIIVKGNSYPDYHLKEKSQNTCTDRKLKG